LQHATRYGGTAYQSEDLFALEGLVDVLSLAQHELDARHGLTNLVVIASAKCTHDTTRHDTHSVGDAIEKADEQASNLVEWIGGARTHLDPSALGLHLLAFGLGEHLLRQQKIPLLHRATTDVRRRSNVKR
jgi:hypothetical protein